METLRGTGVALVTPFTQSLDVDYEGFGRLIDFVIEGGVDYVVVNGTTGESVTTTTAERKELLRFAIKQVDNRVPVVYGVGGNNTQHIVELLGEIDFTGIDAILSVSPYYNKPSQQGIYQHYVAVADASPVPVILYNVPGRTSSNISAETTLKLASHQNIIGIKEASGNLEQCMYLAKHRPEGFLLISGDDMLTVPMLSFGADGVISVLANGFPGKFCQMVKAGLNQDFKEAGQLLLSFVEINPLMYEESNPVGIKAVLEFLGICSAAVRLPLIEASAGLKDRVQKCL